MTSRVYCEKPLEETMRVSCGQLAYRLEANAIALVEIVFIRDDYGI